MNFYPHHIGDYAQATRHLSLLEHGAYRTLLDLYYSREAPLPADLAACCRLVMAVSKDERRAVDTVLREFFHLGDDGWRHRRCDAEIAKATSKRTKASESASKRWQSRGNAIAPADAMRSHSDGNAPNPNPNPNPPQPPAGGEGGTSDPPAAEPSADPPPGPPSDGGGDPVAALPEPSPAVRLALAARAAGVECTGSDPRLHELAAQGVTVSTLVAAIDEARRTKARPPLGYVIAVLGSWAEAASKVAVNGAAPPGRGAGVVVAHPSSATVDEATMRRISDAHGGLAVERLPDGRYRCGVHYFRPDGRREVLA